MDLVSFIPGVGPTKTFTPGASTPAPFNGTHTGLTDGTGPLDSSKNMAEIYNRILLQIASVIVKSGITVNNNNWAQLGDAVQALVNGSSQTLSLSGHTLSISGGNSVTLPDADNQTLGISGNTLSISGGNSVSLPDADNQTLGISGNTLSISGGNSITLPGSGFGDGQNWSQPSRAGSTWYQNTTNKPIMVNILFGSYGGGTLSVGPAPGSAAVAAQTANDIHQVNQMSAVVPSGYYYYLAPTGNGTGPWFELS